ncbi:MAG: serine/threonine-protein kinase [Terracidiphilus sp.]|jgi:serine/threonine-protein kinase
MSIPKTIGRYEIIDELGHGAMGSVFRARDPAMDRVVALKTILTTALASEQGGEYRQRFYREARAAGALAHPGIVPVFDVGEHEGMPYLVMEFVNGRTLAAAMKTGERASLDRVCEIGQQIADALGYAHRNGVIHRDIKPANILLTSRETYGDERPKITDFGVAKLTAGEITTTGQLLGTPAFMPPEQFTGATIDGRTDLFSLGVILYWMVTGEQPFAGETMTAVSYKIVHTEPIPPAKLNPAIPAPLEAVILKCLAKSPAERYQTGDELAQALAELRTNAKTSGMHTVVPQAMAAGGDSAPTSLPPKSGMASVHPSAVQPPKQTPPAKPAKPAKPLDKKLVLIIAAVVLVAAVAAGGGYLLTHRSQPAPQQPPPAPVAATPQAPAPSQPAPSTPEKAAPAPQAQASEAAKAAKPKPGKNVAAQPAAQPAPAPVAQPAPAPVAPPVAAPAPSPQSAAVAFDPKKLDPKQNTRLKFDFENFPPNYTFTVEMGGKTYFKGSSASPSDYSNLFVPPGVHEFRVSVSSGGAQKASNIVSAEFVASKRMTLKVELRSQSNGTAPLPVLDATTQIVATLKKDRFFF